MSKWVYRTVSVIYDKKRKNWVTESAEMDTVLGLQAILDEYGSLGWELVDLSIDRLRTYVQLGGYAVEPEAYRATFKRMVED